MSKRISALLICLVILLSVPGCYGINMNVQVSEPVRDTAVSEEGLLDELVPANSFDEMIKRHGRVCFDIKRYMKDGSVLSEYNVYKDNVRYVISDRYGTLIIEDNDAYGYDNEADAPFRYVFIDSFDSFVENREFTTFYVREENEKITSVEEKDGLIRMETVITGESIANELSFYGYDESFADHICDEYVIDAKTKEILKLSSYFEGNGQKTLCAEQIFDPDCPAYVPDQKIVDGVFGDDVRTVNVIIDAGTGDEKKYTQTVKKGAIMRIEADDDHYSTPYTDPDCLTPLKEIDKSKDITVYLKDAVDYSKDENWAYNGIGDGKDADLFLICPTVDMNDEFNMSMDDTDTKANFLGALNMERGIYEDYTRMYAPYYRQGAMKIYSMTAEEREPYLEYAYEDISEAFYHYLIDENQGRPIILAGFSQGADMCYRLLKDYFSTEYMQDRLVAVYAIGWPCTEEMTKQYPQIKPAESESDTGVVVSIDCEAPDVTDTFITPAGIKAFTINPLNWKTDGTPAAASENLGACFTDYDGNITKEEKGFCGCYIDEERAVLKVPDVDPADYPALVPGLPEGAYHIYDYQFFFRNLEENVGKRTAAFMGRGEEPGIEIPEGYHLVWSDEFDSDALSADDWNYETHEKGWVNNELQEYVASPEYAFVKDGELVIRPVKEEKDGKVTYTSGRVNTQNKHYCKYGRFEARIKVPRGKGFLPAFWMMPEDESFYGQWPKCGEIDIMEVLGDSTKVNYGTLHYGEPHMQSQNSYSLTDGDFADEYHVFAVEWEPGEIRWYCDGEQYHSTSEWFTAQEGEEEKPYPAPFNQPFHVILNVAVGGDWPGAPDESTVFDENACMYVDYVRMFQKDSYDENVKRPVPTLSLRKADESGNFVYNGDFSENEDLTDDENWKFLLFNGGEGEAKIGDNEIIITSSNEGTEEYSVQLVQPQMPMEKGCSYEFSFEAYAEEPRTIKPAITAPDVNWIRYFPDTPVDLTNEWQTFTFDVDMNDETDDNGRVEFNMGKQGSTATVHIRNVRLIKK